MHGTPAKRARKVRMSYAAKSVCVRRGGGALFVVQTISCMPLCHPFTKTGAQGAGACMQLQGPAHDLHLNYICLQGDGHPGYDISKLQQLAEACAASAPSCPNSPAQLMLTPAPRMVLAGHPPGAGSAGPGPQGALSTAPQHVASTPAAEEPQPRMVADIASDSPRQRGPSSPPRQGQAVTTHEQPEVATGQGGALHGVKGAADRATPLLPEAQQLQLPDTVTRPPRTETARGPALDPGALAALRTLEGYLHEQQGRLEQGRSQVLALRTEQEGLRMQLEQQSRARADAEEEARKLREELGSCRAAAEAQARVELEQLRQQVEQQQQAAVAAARRAAELQAQRDVENERLQGQHRELQGKYQEVCDKHLQVLERYEEVLGDRAELLRQLAALQGRLTAAEQRAVAAERRAMEASAGMRAATA